MPGSRKTADPFHVALVLAGIAFTVTACAYGVMTLHRHSLAGAVADLPSGSWLLDFLDRHGFATLMVELAVLAAAVGAAIGRDVLARRRRTP